MKTIQELEAMADDELRVVLAKLDGHVNLVTTCWRSHKVGIETAVPNYPADLNACHAVERGFDDVTCSRYSQKVRNIWASAISTVPAEEYGWHMTARQRTIALIATLQAQPPHKPLNTTV